MVEREREEGGEIDDAPLFWGKESGAYGVT